MLSLKQRKALCITTGKGSWELAETSDIHTGNCQVLSIELTQRWLPGVLPTSQGVAQGHASHLLSLAFTPGMSFLSGSVDLGRR